MSSALSLTVHDAAAVRAGLDIATLRPAIAEAMIALSQGRVRQNLRSFIGLGEGRTFALMPAAFDGQGLFGAKLVSVFADGAGRKAHEGVVVLFDGQTGVPVCIADAGEITALRTAAASAVATQALARPDASILAILGAGRQAAEHITAIAQVRPLEAVRVWGRDLERTQAFAADMSARIGVAVTAKETPRDAAHDADILCTVTTSVDPVLEGDWVAPGAHVNVVGSSGPMAAEIDTDLVARSRFIVDHAEHVRAHGGEYLRALASGRITPDHIAAEIGTVLSGAEPGRRSDAEITIYKSLGHAAQDITAAGLLLG
ncbi:ornithine cyclodeaminase family protein [Brevundimonas sp. SORGH_AS_0993]|uniref:ornithine cyclodeaminase family protein n=1 Tax=Brevundimonas sp. SORGH_AS_0993 TaxID=3041794 RepID=UPI00278AF8DC|nr:ornithine cyclodeaminase family protein [Brevundimonas sp. SORGH_AS_0993]MDQ1155513.1 ornithine cyclodeaminase/alanine dehydrogenase-like protein (mu-crystallin family) [Brevundimonas sp. SORGH_AS_0993]